MDIICVYVSIIPMVKVLYPMISNYNSWCNYNSVYMVFKPWACCTGVIIITMTIKLANICGGKNNLRSVVCMDMVQKFLQLFTAHCDVAETSAKNAW